MGTKTSNNKSKHNNHNNYNNHIFVCLYSMFVNHHIFVVLRCSVHHVDGWNCLKSMDKSKYTLILVFHSLSYVKEQIKIVIFCDIDDQSTKIYVHLRSPLSNMNLQLREVPSRFQNCISLRSCFEIGSILRRSTKNAVCVRSSHPLPTT